MIANSLFLCMLIVGWFLCFRIHRHQPQRETLFIVIFMTVLVTGNVIAVILEGWPGFNSEQCGIIYDLASFANLLAIVFLVGAWGLFSYLERRGKNGVE